MTVRKTLSRSITLLVSLLLAASVAASYISILSDRKVAFICDLTASHSGKYQTVITYTDDHSDRYDSQKDGDRILKSEIELQENVPFTLDLKRVLPRTVRIHTADIAVKSLDETADDITVVLSGLKVNRRDVSGLYATEENSGKIIAEKCADDACASKVTGSFSLKLKGSEPGVLSVTSNLNLKAYRGNVAIMAILIIVTVGTGIFYKLIRYVLHKRREQSVNVPDIVFITAVILTSFIPALMFNTKQAPDLNENRFLADYKPLLTEDDVHPINLTWTKDFETWFNDRFGGRTQLINIQRQLVLGLTRDFVISPKSDVCQIQNSWCFSHTDYEQPYATGGYTGALPNLDYISKIAAAVDVPIYALIYPHKSEIYWDKALFSDTVLDPKRGFSFLAEEHLKKVAAPNVHVINLKPVFEKDRVIHPNGLPYLIDEHHATEYGNRLVMDYLNANAPEFKERNHGLDIDKKYPPQQFQIGSGEFLDPGMNPSGVWAVYGQSWGNVFGHGNRVRRNSRFQPQAYPFYSLTDKYRSDISYEYDPKCDSNIHLRNRNAPNFKVYIIGNSFVETLSKMAATEASDVFRRRINSSCGAKNLFSNGVIKQLKELKPDVVLMAIFSETFGADLK